MDEKELQNLFESLGKYFGNETTGPSKEVLSRLVKIALKYHDMLEQKNERPLTVGETKKALDELLHVIRQKKFAEETPNRIKRLVTLWFEEIKIYLYN